MKHWKKILISFITILLIVGGYIVYTFQFKEYDVADIEVTEITKESYNLELPDGTVIDLNEDGDSSDPEETELDGEFSDSATSTSGNETSSSADAGSGTSGLGSDDTREDSGSTSGTPSGSSPSGSQSGTSNKEKDDSTPTKKQTKDITVSSIKAKYTPALSSLEAQANDRINALVGRAVEEYQSKKENNESVNYAYFYNKYTSAAAELEGRTDRVFHQVIGIIEKELVANGYSKEHAQTLVNDYNAAKEARRSALINKAMNQ